MTEIATPGLLIAALYFSAGFTGFGLLTCLVAWTGRERILGLPWLAAMCISAIGYQIAVANFHLATDASALFAAKRWQNSFALAQMYILFGFVSLYMQLRQRRLLLWVMGLLLGVMLSVAIFRPPELHFAHHFQVAALSFPWGERLYTLRGEISTNAYLGRAFFLGFFVWMLYLTTNKRSQLDRTGTFVLRSGLVMLIVSTFIGGMVETGQMNFIYPGGFGYILFATMAFYLVLHELNTSQTQLAHTEAALTQELDEHQQTQRVVEHLSFNDRLTDLPSRAGLFRIIDQSIDAAQHQQTRFAVLHVDIDRFDVVNDTLGPQVGDQLLQHASKRLANLLDERNFVARINADEFICVVAAEQAGHTAIRIHETLRNPFEISNHTLHITASIGVALYPDDATTADSLMTAVDLATREAKRLGRDRTEIFHHELTTVIQERMHLGNALRIALAEQQFELYFQPQIDAHSGAIAGLEALIRWKHPESGMIPPDRFIPLAEEMRLIDAIGTWVIEETCRILSGWRKAGIHGIRVAINLSAQQLRQNNLVDIVQAALQRHGLNGNDLEMEVTESMVMEDPDLCIAQLQRLKTLGITLAMDDFGTGYSSLAYLKRLPIDTLKIDRTFVRDLETDANDKAICATTISMANTLGLDTVAEGVETSDQARMLRELQCDRFQGYYYAKPMPAVEVVAFFKKQDLGHMPTSSS